MALGRVGGVFVQQQGIRRLDEVGCKVRGAHVWHITCHW